jgi:hypothetical protein
MRLTGAVYANFLNMELPHLLENIPLIFLVNQWFQHDGAPPHFSRNVQDILNRMNNILIVGSDEATGLHDLRISILWIFLMGVREKRCLQPTHS